jgi:hypothetical protein
MPWLVIFSGIGNIHSEHQGMVQAWVGHFVTPLKCMYDKYDWQVTSQKPHKKHKHHDKQHHHGVGAARPSSGVDLMIGGPAKKMWIF